MLYSTITAILFTAATVTAYQVPKGAKNGRYECYTDSKTGKEVHVYIGPLLDNVPKYDPKNDVPPNVGKRENEFHSAKFALRSLTGPNNIYCEHIYLNNVDTDNANNNLDAQCGNGAPTPSSENGRDKYSIAGGTVAYFCNMSGGTNHCYARQGASARVTSGCGRYWGGDDTVPDRSVVYGYQHIGAKFCGRGVNGK